MPQRVASRWLGFISTASLVFPCRMAIVFPSKMKLLNKSKEFNWYLSLYEPCSSRWSANDLSRSPPSRSQMYSFLNPEFFFLKAFQEMTNPCGPPGQLFGPRCSFGGLAVWKQAVGEILVRSSWEEAIRTVLFEDPFSDPPNLSDWRFAGLRL